MRIILFILILFISNSAIANIISSEIVSDRLQGTTSRKIQEKHVDHVGKVYMPHYRCSVGFDADSKLLLRASEIEINSIEHEKEYYINQARNGINIDPGVVPVYITKSNLLKALIKTAFLEATYATASSIINIIDSLTDTQIKNAAGITQAKVDKLRIRVTALKSLRTSINDDNLNVELSP